MCARFLLLFLIGSALSSCAGPQLRENTVDMGPAFGSVQERQVIKNLGRFMTSPWSIPGQIDVTGGTLQVQNQAALAFKLPYSAISAQEADPSAQSQEQDSFVVTPVTDGDDLRRLQALYAFAVCHDARAFVEHWEETIRPYEIANAKTAAAAAKPSESEQAALTSLKSINDTLNKIRSDLENKEKERDALGKNITRPKLDESISLLQQRQTNLVASLATVNQALSGTPPSSSGTSSSQQPTPNSGPSDSVELERAKENLIVHVLNRKRFLYWTNTGSPAANSSPCQNISIHEASPPPGSNFLLLGSAAGFDFWTDDPDKVAQFTMFVLGSTPNTSGVHVLTSKQPSSSPPKAQGNQLLLFKSF